MGWREHLTELIELIYGVVDCPVHDKCFLVSFNYKDEFSALGHIGRDMLKFEEYDYEERYYWPRFHMLPNLLTHLLSPEVNTVGTLFARSLMAPLDFNLILWEATEKKLIRITGDKIKLTDKKFAATLDVEVEENMTELQRKCYRTVVHYDKNNKYVPEVEFHGPLTRPAYRFTSRTLLLAR